MAPISNLACLTAMVLASWANFATGRKYGHVPDEQVLFENLMRNYQKSVRPVSNASTVVLIKFSLHINQIIDLDERQQVLSTDVYINQKWIDEKLKWNPSRYNGITSLRVSADDIWRPDTFMYNNADQQTSGFMHGTFVQVHSDGSVFWPVPVKLKSACKVNINYFPFDEQVCLLQFGSWVYNGQWLDYTPMFNDTPVELTNYVNNSEWELYSATLEQSGVTATMTSSPSQSSSSQSPRRCLSDHPKLTYKLLLHRKTFYYLFNVIVPCIMLSVLTLLTFWLPPTSGEKVTLGLSVFLAFSMFMLLIAEEVPATSDTVPLIGIYLCVVMTMTSASVMVAVIVINIYNRGMKMRRAPAWFRRLTLVWMSKVLHLEHNIELVAQSVVLDDFYFDVVQRPSHATQIERSYSKYDINCQNSPIFMRHNNNSERCHGQPSTVKNRRYSQKDVAANRDQIETTWLRQEEHEALIQNIQSKNAEAAAAAAPQRTGNGNEIEANQQVLNVQRLQGDRQTMNEQGHHDDIRCCDVRCSSPERASTPSCVTSLHKKRVVIAEWQRIAAVIDRAMFWFYFVATFVSYFVILIIIPAQHYNSKKHAVVVEPALQTM
ncbi:neuronal acetylcholine receptor subunit alpha-10-like [Gigantopelta aegis]|uniref:neuronal acetylcholine receptor subunit alpha-10-like n=1 Tax=Gigantopelta aegis TaxID=1735272 RepID=UPI001B887DC2|nr:neuronal acetylcholine receptor subunit alpha-10-like [Gigantopelta aegis]